MPDSCKEKILEPSLSELTCPQFINSCCRVNRPPPQPNTPFNLSECTHAVRGVTFKSVPVPLAQIKLHWYQECLICSSNSSSAQHSDAGVAAYIGDQVLASWLELTCREARELFKKSAASAPTATADSANALFAQKVAVCQQRLANIATCRMHLKFDLDRNKFCIVQIDEIKNE